MGGVGEIALKVAPNADADFGHRVRVGCRVTLKEVGQSTRRSGILAFEKLVLLPAVRLEEFAECCDDLPMKRRRRSRRNLFFLPSLIRLRL